MIMNIVKNKNCVKTQNMLNYKVPKRVLGMYMDNEVVIIIYYSQKNLLNLDII